ncbi:zinc finger protein 830 isoform X2 [Ischnura elegans]|uniref:zinc finger protein 830 isoform X2 n=1 Tax=Ischnura elegans TaxID=197161 RepID=UPI001ED88195|nr:zinc finger protein 830 isoform X2 [Ischnura elegans]
MASNSNPTRKTISQSELRKIMLEQKKKLLQNTKKIDSPLAKYSKDGQLSCILCGSIVRSEAVWNVHINGKQHKENILNSKKRRDDQLRVKDPGSTLAKLNAGSSDEPPPKKHRTASALPSNFFDCGAKTLSDEGTSTTPKNILMNDYTSDAEESGESIEIKNAVKEDDKKVPKDRNHETLPEGFFDDPVLDAKVRNVEYKDPIEEEWERFQRAIKEEATVSAQIIMEDQEEAIAERQIHEIEEQMRNWSRVIDLEKKREEVNSSGVKIKAEDDESSSSANEEEFEEYLDWRAKQS